MPIAPVDATEVTKNYCNVAAQALSLDPGGYGGHFDDAVLIETALPWKRDIYQTAGGLPQEAIDLLALWLKRYRESGIYPHRPLLIAPDEAYTRPGYRRVIYYQRPVGLWSRFERQEYLVPDDDTGLLLWALFEEKESLAHFQQYRVRTQPASRDILVCTHGTIDVACAKFGYPLYRHLRDEFADEDVHVWRVSHFGGHIFAPTLIDMPTGHYWAYVGEKQAGQIMRRDGDVSALRGHYRGWAGAENGFAQAAEREVWQQKGWGWFDTAKSCAEMDGDPNEEDPQWAEVRIDSSPGHGASNSYRVRIEVQSKLETAPSSDETKIYTYAQYAVTRLERIESL